MTVPLAAVTATERITGLLAEVTGLAILAGTLALVVAFAYRWYVREPIPLGLALLVGLGGIAAYLNTTAILGQIIDGAGDVTREALFSVGAFVVGLGGATVGRRLGDDFGADVFGATGLGEVEDGMSRLVQTLGRVVTVELPDEIEDVVGYDPVSPSTKAALAGRTFVFPRRLTVEELRERVVARLKTDYAVGHVDVELAADGTVEHLAVGSRAAGIGPTLPPATNAVAVRADPAFAASAGDLVQVWETDPLQRILTAELRGVADDVVTLAIDSRDTPKLDPETEYRLVTLPVEDRPDREFASLLRAADETFSSVTVAPGSPLSGITVGALEVAVVSVTSQAGEPAILPGPEHVLEAGVVVHAIARPEALRRLEAAGEQAGDGRDATPDAVGEAGDAGIGPASILDADGEEGQATPPNDDDDETWFEGDGDGSESDDDDDEGEDQPADHADESRTGEDGPREE